MRKASCDSRAFWPRKSAASSVHRRGRMLFNTLRFFLFLGIVLLLFYTSPARFKKPLLLAASYFFYVSFIPKYLFVLLALTLIDYTAAICIERATTRRA